MLTFVSLSYKCSASNLSLIGQAVSEEIMEIVDGRRRANAGISSSFEPKGSCELKIEIHQHTPVVLYKSVVQGGIHFMDMLS